MNVTTSVRATQLQLEKYLRHGRRKKALLADDSQAVVEEQGTVAARFGYEPLSDLLRSELTGEWYQWWERKPQEQ